MYKPRFTINNAILKHIGTIEAAREIILSAPLLPAWEKRFREDAIVRTVHHGTHIEGNELNRDEAEKVMKGQDIVGRARDIQEVINYRNVLNYIENLGKESKEKQFNEDILKKIHTLTTENILAKEKSGQIRTTQVVIKNSATGEVTFRPPSSLEVPYQLKDLFAWLNGLSRDDIHSVLKSGIIHYEIVRIHPFVDGNGRVARALSTLSLMWDEYDIRRFFSLEEYYDNDAERYYGALQTAISGDLTKWLVYFSEGLAIELTRIKERIQKLSTDISFKHKLGGKPVYLQERQIQMIEYMQQMGYIQNQTFRELFPGVSEDTILRDLHDLIKKGIIKKEGKTKAARYILKSS
ncbi:Fic family protein [Candidatus Gottesmanbacteria bacterium]|nr:Fic family protein [Candidatus Gottesmanbacteria bacterium]